MRLAVSSSGSADVSSLLAEADTSLAAKLAVPDPVKAGKSFTAKLTKVGRKTGTATPDASFIARPSISQRWAWVAHAPLCHSHITPGATDINAATPYAGHVACLAPATVGMTATGCFTELKLGSDQ